jgi:RNA polymerase sigma-70 factor (ECF subfamily)
MEIDFQKTLIESCKKGDRKSQHRLYQTYCKAMYNVCLRMMKNKFEAEDLLQNSFVDVFSKLDTYNYQSTPGAWIKRICINNCINELKRKKIQLTQMNEDLAMEPMPELDERKINVQIIQNAISELPEGYRVVFSLYAIEGYDHEEISEIMGVSVSTSKSQYHRAKKKLKEIILQSNDMESLYIH